jgi:glycosyltransferase involved in cell wall biosynthesis
MLPHITKFGQGESGIRRVVEAYNKCLPEFGIELVTPDTYSYDLTAVHAGVAPGADVAHNHGLYWTEDIPTLSDYEWNANIAVINSLREARQITVPSEWVAESIRRDMRIDPHVIGHGIEWDEWQGKAGDGGYVLWNKNRDFDVCNPEAIVRLARLFKTTHFMSTFAPNPSPNLRVTGQVPFEQMRQMVLGCAVYLSSIKETFGIGTLEAMAAGKPILGWAEGGNLDLVQHGVNGYLAQPGNYEDLANGLEYCLQFQRTLGDNGREMARAYNWREVCEQVARVYELAYEDKADRPTVGIVIPVYNKDVSEVVRAVSSCCEQTFAPDEIIIINDGSDSDEFSKIMTEIDNIAHDPDIDIYFREQNNQGVAATRNNGIAELGTKYVCCLDADDWLESDHFFKISFLSECIAELEKDNTIGIAYTGLKWHNHQTGESKISDWPGAYVAEKQFNYEARQNQIPTACVFRRDAWERVGGYRSRYCPNGAGSEDAAFWSQILSIGYTAKQVTTEPLFNYSLGGQVSTDKEYQEIDWLAWLPFSRDKRYPFACSVLPARYSHPVRQYDEPELSIVIPVGPGHEDDLRTALDSIEAQHFRNWEVVVIFDTGETNRRYTKLGKAYPYIKVYRTLGRKGAGFARNRGAELARGKFLLFLDADDFLNPSEPNALGEMLETFWETGNGVYSAHIGRAIVSSEYAKEHEDRVMAWNEKLKQAYIFNPGIDYDCQKAVAEPRHHPDGKFYIWNLISTLIPRQWHFGIGGFDENMPTWEDWDYWLRMAKAGRCFTRIQKPFIIYNYISGNRREVGRQIWSDVLEYLKDKHKDVAIVGCGCGSKKRAGEPVAVNENMVEAWYTHPNPGRHHVVVNGYNYGRHLGGGAEHFQVRISDLETNPHLFRAVQQIVADPTPQPQAMPEPAPLAPPISQVEEKFPLHLLGLKAQGVLMRNGVDVDTTKKEINDFGYDELVAISGIGPATAKRILELAK